jgi:endonuclease IV
MTNEGITLNWHERYSVTKYDCNIVQLLFQQKTEYISPNNKDLFGYNKFLNNKRIKCYVHISVNLNIAHAYAQNLFRIKTEIIYGHKIGAIGFVIHCGSKKGHHNTEISEETFDNKLRIIRSLTNKDLFIENSASKKCFGKSVQEITEYIERNNSKNTYIVFDTQHWYAAGESEDQVIQELHNNQKIRLLHINGIPDEVTHGSGQDKHAPLWNKISEKMIKAIEKLRIPKILETPRQELWKEELNKLRTKEVCNMNKEYSLEYAFTVPVIINNERFDAIVDTAAEVTTISKNAAKRLKNVRKVKSKGEIYQAGSEGNVTQWIEVEIKVGKNFKRKIQCPVMQQYRDILLGTHIVGLYNINLRNGTMKGFNEIIQIKPRKMGNKQIMAVEFNLTYTQLNQIADEYENSIKKKYPMEWKDREWRKQKMKAYRIYLVKMYKRPTTRRISETFIDQLWENRKTYFQEKGYYDYYDGSNEERYFRKWIREIFDKPIHIRTGRYEWENKPLPEIPKDIETYQKEYEQLEQYNDFERFIDTRPKIDIYDGTSIRDLYAMYERPSRSNSTRRRSNSRGRRSRSNSTRRRSNSKNRYYDNVVLRNGKVTRPSQEVPRIIISNRNSTGNSSPSRAYTPPSQFNTPRHSPRRTLNDPPSLSNSRQQSPIRTQSSRNSSSRRSSESSERIQRPVIRPIPLERRRSSSSREQEPIPTYGANAGLVINGEINGFRLQVIFSTIHQEDWLTVTTAQRCGIQGNRLQNDHYLERTYMDHQYNQRSRNRIRIRLGQDNQGRDVEIRTNDIVPIVKTNNFFYQSQSLADPRSRYFILIGRNTQIAEGIEIIKQKIRIPNPNYVAPVEKRYYEFRAMNYPDLTNQNNLDFNIIQNVLKKESTKD